MKDIKVVYLDAGPDGLNRRMFFLLWEDEEYGRRGQVYFTDVKAVPTGAAEMAEEDVPAWLAGKK
jgi:hypothetical protein